MKRETNAPMSVSSPRSVFKNFKRTGALKNSLDTVTSVPCANASEVSSISPSVPPTAESE